MCPRICLICCLVSHKLQCLINGCCSHLAPWLPWKSLVDRCKWKGLWIWSEYMYFDAFYQTDIYWLFSDFMTRSEREETIRSCSVIPPTAPTFLAFSDQLQVIPATKWSPKGWVCNTLNHWAAAFDLKVNANTLKSIWVGLCWWTQLVCNSSQLVAKLRQTVWTPNESI